MDLRRELIPAPLDAQLVARLTKLAAAIDCARKGAWEDKLFAFNTLAGTNFCYGDFYEISGAEEHIDWVRRVLTRQRVRPVLDVTRDELIEVIRRAFPGNQDAELYMIIFDANVLLKQGSLLIYYRSIMARRPGGWTYQNTIRRLKKS